MRAASRQPPPGLDQPTPAFGMSDRAEVYTGFLSGQTLPFRRSDAPTLLLPGPNRAYDCCAEVHFGTPP
jgi:hypothetical protein